MGDKTTYTSREVGQLLGFATHILKEMRETGELLYTRLPNGFAAFNSQYIDGIVAALAQYPPKLREQRDGAFFLLMARRWEYYELAPTNASKHVLGVYRKDIKNKCDALVARGRAFTVPDLAERIGRSADTLYRWCDANKVVRVQIGTTSYVSSRFGRYLIKLFTEWLTVYEVSALSALSHTRVQARINSGELAAVLCPDRTYRVDPEVADEFAAIELATKGDSIVSIKQAAAQIDISHTSLMRGITLELVKTVGNGHRRRRVLRSEVQRWKAYFTTLNAPFSWLQRMPHQKKLRTMTVAQAATTLEISTSTVKLWGGRDLLPFYPGSFTQGKKLERHFVRQYVLGLRKFAGEGAVPMKTAQHYLGLCREQELIV